MFLQVYTGEQNSSPVLKTPNVELKAGSRYPPHNGGESTLVTYVSREGVFEVNRRRSAVAAADLESSR
jgi:hypothetical protein